MPSTLTFGGSAIAPAIGPSPVRRMFWTMRTIAQACVAGLRHGVARAERVVGRRAGRARLPAGLGDRVEAGGRKQDLLVGQHRQPELPGAGARAGSVEEVLEVAVEARHAPGLRVGPDRQVAEHVVAVEELLDARRLSAEHDHLPGVAVDPAVGRLRRLAEPLVAVAVSGAERRGKSLLLAPLPEVLLEDLALVRLGQLDEEILLLGENDRLDVDLEPLALFLGQGLDPLRPSPSCSAAVRWRRSRGRRLRAGPARRRGVGAGLGLRRRRQGPAVRPSSGGSGRGLRIGRIAQRGASGSRPVQPERGREDENRDLSRLHRTENLNSRKRYRYSLKIVLLGASRRSDNLKSAPGI